VSVNNKSALYTGQTRVVTQIAPSSYAITRNIHGNQNRQQATRKHASALT